MTITRDMARMLATTAVALVALALTPAAREAEAKPVQNTFFSLATSQGLTGTLSYFSKHETEGRRYVFAQVQVQVQCGTEFTRGTLTMSGKLGKRDNDGRFQVSGVNAEGVTVTGTMAVTLLPKIKGGKKKKKKKARGWKRAEGSVTYDAVDGVNACTTGLVQFSSVITGRF